MKTKLKKQMIRYAAKHKLDDNVLLGIMTGGETKATVYGRVIGKHPTKKGRYYV